MTVTDDDVSEAFSTLTFTQLSGQARPAKIYVNIFSPLKKIDSPLPQPFSIETVSSVAGELVGSIVVQCDDADCGRPPRTTILIFKK